MCKWGPWFRGKDKENLSAGRAFNRIPGGLARRRTGRGGRSTPGRESALKEENCDPVKKKKKKNHKTEKSQRDRSRVCECERFVAGRSVAGRCQILQGLQGTGVMSVIVAGMTTILWRIWMSW